MALFLKLGAVAFLANILSSMPAIAEGEDGWSLTGRLINISMHGNSVHEYDLASGTRRMIYQFDQKHSASLEHPIVRVGDGSFIIFVRVAVPTSWEGDGIPNVPVKVTKNFEFRPYMFLVEDGETHYLRQGRPQAFFPKHGKLLYIKYHLAERLRYLYEAELAGRRLGPERNVGIAKSFGEVLMLSDDEALVEWESGTHSHARYNMRTGHVVGMSLGSCRLNFVRSSTGEVICYDRKNREYVAVDLDGHRRIMEFGEFRLETLATYVPQGDYVIGWKARVWNLKEISELYALDLKTGRYRLIGPGGTGPGWSYWESNRS